MRKPKDWSESRFEPAPQHDAYIELDQNDIPFKIWWNDADRDDFAACALIHEAAHVLLRKHPFLSDEIDSPMLWWERLLRREAKVSHLGRWEWMMDFSMGSYVSLEGFKGPDFRLLSSGEKARVYLWSRARAAEVGNLLGTFSSPA